jgi:hypothetical protein
VWWATSQEINRRVLAIEETGIDGNPPIRNMVVSLMIAIK